MRLKQALIQDPLLRQYLLKLADAVIALDAWRVQQGIQQGKMIILPKSHFGEWEEVF